MNLRGARIQFTTFISTLSSKAKELEYDLAFDELTNHQNKGHRPESLHYCGLAGDILLYDKDGHYITDEKGYTELGEYWKSLHPYCKWGGDFGSKDYNHFSFCPPEVVGNRQ